MTTAAVIWIIDDEQWPRAFLRAELIGRGYDAVGFHTIDDALAGHTERPPQVIVLELHGQKLDREALGRLLAAAVPVILLASMPEANDPLIADLRWAAVLHRPVSIGEIADAVIKAAGSVKSTRGES
jgi:DNA-binding response OmpR family regulator